MDIKARMETDNCDVCRECASECMCDVCKVSSLTVSSKLKISFYTCIYIRLAIQNKLIQIFKISSGQ